MNTLVYSLFEAQQRPRRSSGGNAHPATLSIRKRFVFIFYNDTPEGDSSDSLMFFLRCDVRRIRFIDWNSP